MEVREETNDIVVYHELFLCHVCVCVRVRVHVHVHERLGAGCTAFVSFPIYMEVGG